MFATTQAWSSHVLLQALEVLWDQPIYHIMCPAGHMTLQYLVASPERSAVCFPVCKWLLLVMAESTRPSALRCCNTPLMLLQLVHTFAL